MSCTYLLTFFILFSTLLTLNLTCALISYKSESLFSIFSLNYNISSYSFKKSDWGINSEFSFELFSSSISNSLSSSSLFEIPRDWQDFDSSTDSSSFIIWIVGSKTSLYFYSAFFLFLIKILFR